MFDTTSKHN